jgi:hypothetical protein
LLSLIALVIATWGQLAIAAVAIDPANNQADAGRIATRRFGPALGIYAMAALALVLLAVPVAIALAGSNIDWAAVSRGDPPQIGMGVASFVLLYGIVFTLVLVFVGARLFLLNPVILTERRGLGAFARSWSLTKGLTWRIVGVMLLFLIVWLVAGGAAQLVIGIVLRLVLGADALGTVQFVTALVSSVLATIYMVVVGVFAARLYVNISERRASPVLS